MAETRTLRILITAGPTREPIDPVRYISNESSGAMGAALAQAARDRGHTVTLIHGPLSLPLPAGVQCQPVMTAAQLLAACRAAWPQQDALIMAAAVADYRPAEPLAHKHKKSQQEWTLRLEPTEDILATLSAERRPGQVVVGFALEDRDGRRNAESKLTRKNLDAIVLNSPSALGAAHSELEILVRGGSWRTLAPAIKSKSAMAIVEITEELLRAQPA